MNTYDSSIIQQYPRVQGTSVVLTVRVFSYFPTASKIETSPFVFVAFSLKASPKTAVVQQTDSSSSSSAVGVVQVPSGRGHRHTCPLMGVIGPGHSHKERWSGQVYERTKGHLQQFSQSRSMDRTDAFSRRFLSRQKAGATKQRDGKFEN